jgi:outer membrane biosynthesis protein TonB
MSKLAEWTLSFGDGIKNAVNSITNNNYLNYAVASGFGDIPVAAYGMTIIVLSTLAYATAADSKNLTDLSNVTKNVVSMLPTFSQGEKTSTRSEEEIKADESKKIEKEEAEYQKEIEKEEAEKKKQEEEEKKKAEEEEKAKEKANADEKINNKENDEDDDEPNNKKYDRDRRGRNDDDDDDDSESLSRGGTKKNKRKYTKKRQLSRMNRRSSKFQ